MSSYQIDTILHFIVTKKYKQSNIIEKKELFLHFIKTKFIPNTKQILL